MDAIADDKTRTSFSITKECSELITAIANHHGISRNAVLEIITRHYAKALGITATPVTPER